MDFLSAKDEAIFKAWESVPPELWSGPDIYNRENYAKVYKKIQKKGLAAIGFDKTKLFDACISLIEKRDSAEDIQVELTGRVHRTLSENGGSLDHYDLEENTVYSFQQEKDVDQYLYKKYNTDDFIEKLRDRLGVATFCHSKESLSNKNVLKIGDDSWQRTYKNFDHIGVYQEVQEYIDHSKKFRELKSQIFKLSISLPVLFQIDESILRKITCKPCLLHHKGRQFYLTAFEGVFDIKMNYEATSLCII